jgi:hypothetical protein
MPGPSRIFLPELPGANGRKPYWSDEQSAWLAQPGTATNADGEYQGKSVFVYQSETRVNKGC